MIPFPLHTTKYKFLCMLLICPLNSHIPREKLWIINYAQPIKNIHLHIK
jgi:hypothetical protein